MKRIVLFILLIPNLLFAEEELKKVFPIYRISSEFNKSIATNSAVYEFQFDTRNGLIQEELIRYSIDGVNGSKVLKNKTLTIQSTPGKHIFQLYYNDVYNEVYSDSLKIEARHHDSYSVTFHYARIQKMNEKPVIYLYPQLETKVRVEMDIHGDDIFTYPQYDDAWNFVAHPNGDLVFGENTYNYLFWEASQRAILTAKQTASGFFVEGKNAISFLEEKLTQAGLNAKEQADFITYWGPRLAKNELNFVHFEFNTECDVYANIDISPKPDNLYRVFIVWGAVSERFDVKEQEMKTMNRSGFSVLDWGGQESHIKQSFVNKNQKTEL